MKKLIGILSLGLLTITQPLLAQTDAKAKSILDAATQKVNSLKSLKANFTLNLASANGKTKQSKSGTFYMKGSKYRISIQGQEIISDNKTVWTYIKESNEVQINNYNPSEQAISPTKLITNFYDKEYKYKYAGTKKSGTKTCDAIELTPINTSKQFSKVEVLVDKASGTIAGGSITEKNGNHYTYTISNFAGNAAVDDKLFTFDPKAYKGVEVVDLR
ncbi:MAG TPA: outer membrane lipoprotein chaperone LolA [Chitinophagaceae bacterium]|nr:outer membrane lipoprotein chaperone LolA [Chitinophagaceae bacterium]